MARYSTVVESATALGSATAFANVVASANNGFKIRRVTLGTRFTTSSPASQLLTVAVYRATARGTQSTTATPVKLDPNSAAAGITGVDTAWSVAPTLAATPLFEVSINLNNPPVDLPWEGYEELVCAAGTANGLAFVNVGNALPVSVLYTLTVEHEE